MSNEKKPLKTTFNEKQYKRIIKLALEKGITLGRQGQGLFKKSDSELAESVLDTFITDIEGIVND